MARATEILKLIISGDAKGLKQALAQSARGVRQWATDSVKRVGRVRVEWANLQSAIAALGVIQTIRSLVNARLAVDSIESSLRVATGSTTAAVREFGFIRKEADRLGLELRSTAEGYASVAAAARGTSLEGQGARDIFIGVVEAMTALGRPADATKGALKAIDQIISKGNVSAEELRGQLGERLPGAFQIAARAIGVTTSELNQMLVNGELLAEDLLPKFAQELHNTFGAEAARRSSGLQAELNRLQTTIFDLASSQNLDPLTDSIRDLRETLADPQVQQGIGTLLAGIVQLVSWTAKLASNFGDVAKGIAFVFTDVSDAQRKVDVLQNQLADVEFSEQLIPSSLSGKALVGDIADAYGAALRKEKEQIQAELQQAQAELDALIARDVEAGNLFGQRDRPTVDTGLPEPAGAGTGTGTGAGGQNKPDAIHEYIAALKDEAATTEQTRAAIARYELQKLGANEATILEAETIIAGTEAKKEEARIERERAEQAEKNRLADEALIDNLREQIELTQLSNLEREQAIAVSELSANATAGQAEEVRKLVAELELLREKQDKTNDDMVKSAETAARGMQAALTDFFLDPFEEGLDGLRDAFLRVIQEMIAEYLAAQTVMFVGRQIGGSVGDAVTAAATQHTGGLAGQGKKTIVPDWIFSGAPRYHGAGVLGLRPDEVPIIGQIGEEVITRDDPRHRFNGGANNAPQPIRVVNVIDKEAIADALATPTGERVVLNIIRRNPGATRGRR